MKTDHITNPPVPTNPLLICADGALGGTSIPTPPGDVSVDVPDVIGPRKVLWRTYRSTRINARPDAPRELRFTGAESTMVYKTAEDMAVALHGAERLGVERKCRGGPHHGRYWRCGGHDSDAADFDLPAVDGFEVTFARYAAVGHELVHVRHRDRLVEFRSAQDRDAAIVALVKRAYVAVPVMDGAA